MFVCANLGFPRSTMRFHSIFSILLICNLEICITFLLYTMDPATAQRPRRGIGTQCDASGKQFATSYAFDQHRRSGYLISTGCHVLDDGSTRSLLVATAANMSTAMLQKLKMKPKHHGMIWRHFANEIYKYAKQQSLKKLLRLLRLHRSLIKTILGPKPEGPVNGSFGC